MMETDLFSILLDRRTGGVYWKQNCFHDAPWGREIPMLNDDGRRTWN
jgi:hypothetical protein